MPLALQKFPVPWIKQQRAYYCGPACAEMVLSYEGVSRDQDYLWEVIKSQTPGNRPSEAPQTDGMYNTQPCYHCGDWHCWDTTPESLALTLNAESPVVQFEAWYPSTLNETTAALVDSIRKHPSAPACATIFAINHWIVIAGYHAGDDQLPGATPFDVNGLPLNGVYINDPEWPDGSAPLRFVPTREFRLRLGSITCGPNTDRYPVVVGSHFWWLIRILMRIWLKIRWWWLRKSEAAAERDQNPQAYAR